MNAVNWERKPLGAVADLCLGKMLDQNKNRGEPLPYLANVNVRWGEFELSDLRTMRFESKEMDRYGLKFGDIVMCEGGEPGRCAIWKDQVPGMMIQKALHRIRPKELLNYRFLFYSFLHLGNSKVFDQYFTGATIKHLPGEKLAKVEVDIPPLPVQQHIAGILSAYDELIENSQRRIKILESMARALYREWFVNFRFPGHESVPRVLSPLGEIPQGWEVRKLGDIVEINKGKNITKKTIRPGDVPVVAGGVEPAYFHDTPNTTRPVVTVSASGANAGFVNLYHVDVWASDCSYIDSSATRNLYYFYLWLDYRRAQVTHLQRGSAQPHVYPKDLAGLEAIDVPEEVISNFTKQVTPIFELMGNLAARVENLRRTRDLLLPRLLSGQINVEVV